MHEGITWRNPVDGLTHRATIRGSVAEGNEIRTDCGLASIHRHEDLTTEAVEITCHRCRDSAVSNGQFPANDATGSENPSLRVPRRESSSPEPKSLADILDEMGFPWRQDAEPKSDAPLFQGCDLIHPYTRKQAIEDGVLIDVSTTAQEAGIRFPTALTSAVWSRFVKVPEGVIAQDEAGRLWDILVLLRNAILRSPSHTDTIYFYLHVRNDNQGTKRFLLKAVCGPDDDGSPCLTIMLPAED